ncbi:MAG TPA: ankyrin repeat domain-containing protein [Thermoanaerobaculia bacterium]
MDTEKLPSNPDSQSLEPQAEQLLAAVRDRDAAGAERLLERHPGIARAHLFAACCAGEADFVEKALAADPQLAIARHEPDGWAPLLYASSSPLHAGSPERARGILRCAELLLERGADPNSHMVWKGPEGEGKLPALYFACVSGNVPVVRLLLERGADPNDGESVYHAAELNHCECLELLLAHGAEISGAHPHWGNTPLYFLAGYKEADRNCPTATEGMRWLLEHGADPNVTSRPTDETPLHRVAAFGRAPAIVELLLAHGAEVDKPRADGRTAYGLAVRADNAAVADLLRQRGADPGKATPVDELLGACLRADAAAARTLLARHPGLPAELTPEDRQALLLAVEEGREASVRLMAELGFGLDWEGPWGGTPLHHAAWRGNVAMVRLLLELGAPVNVRDRQFGSSPLGWAGHGSSHCRNADDDYLAVVEALLAAGADRETSINRWGEPPESMATRRVSALLRKA